MAAQVREIGLVAFIEGFRQELLEAMRRSETERLRFLATKIDLELQVTAEQSGGPEGKVEIKVLGSGLTVGAGGKFANKTVHTVKLSLAPLIDGKRVDPQIHGAPEEWKE